MSCTSRTKKSRALYYVETVLSSSRSTPNSGARSSNPRPPGASIARVRVHGSRTQRLKLNGQQPTRPRLFTESTVVHFVQADLGPAGIRNVRDHMCVKGESIAQDGSGNQTPLGGKFTRTCSRGENCGAF